MKLAFSTLGCPGWSFKEIISTARDAGFDAIEIRGIGEQMYAPAIPEFSDEKIDETLRLLSAVRLRVPVLTSGAALAEPEKAQASFDEACAYIKLASRLGAPYVRVMGTGAPQPETGDWALAGRLYADLCAFAAPLGVTPLLETNGELAFSPKMAELMRAGGANAGFYGMSTIRPVLPASLSNRRTAGGPIRHVHLKDFVIQNGKPAYMATSPCSRRSPRLRKRAMRAISAGGVMGEPGPSNRGSSLPRSLPLLARLDEQPSENE